MIYWRYYEKHFDWDPPRTDISIVHTIKKVYTIIYQIGNKIPKRDKLGIHAHIERMTLDVMKNIISASLSRKNQKLEILEYARVELEVLKNLIRTEYELKIIPEKTYIYTESLLVETSKMTNGWIKYITQNPA